jgi:hypothetical protein
MSGGGGRAPVTHVTSESDTLTTAHATPLMSTAVSATAVAVPNPVPVMVTVVPPSDEPNFGDTLVMTGVAVMPY